MSADNQSGDEKASGETPVAVETLSFEPKWALRSRTVWGVIIGILPQVLALFGIAFDDAEIQKLSSAGIAFLGAILAVYGRAKASRPITVKPTNPYDQGRLWIIVGAVVSISCSGCATVVRDANGIERLRAPADYERLEFKASGTSLVIVGAKHSEPIKAVFNGTMSIITAGGSAFTMGGLR